MYILEKDGERVEMINEQRMRRYVRLGWTLVGDEDAPALTGDLIEDSPVKKRGKKKQKLPKDMATLMDDLAVLPEPEEDE